MHHHEEHHEKRLARQRIALYCIVLFLVFLTVLVIGVFRQMQDQTSVMNGIMYQDSR